MRILRRLFQIVSLLVLAQFLVFVVHGTEISREEVSISLGKSTSVDITLFYRELTSDKLSYLVPYNVQKFIASDSFGRLNCEIRILNIGTEFICIPTFKENYSVKLSFQTKDLVSQKDKIERFEYQHSIVDPTKLYAVKLILPEGYVIFKENDSSVIPIDPPTGIIGSTGRQITIDWTDAKVVLGTTLHFRAYYEKIGFFGNFPIFVFIPLGVIFAIVIVFFIINNKRTLRKNSGSIASLMPALTDDEKQILEFLIKKDKKSTQRNIVRELNLSKAKASRLIHNLEKRDLIKKTKRGRTNLIVIEREIGKLDSTS